MGHIYKLTSPSGSSYIGQSINYKERFKYYSRVNNVKWFQRKLKNSILKYGWDGLEKEILTECCDCMLNVLEKFYIAEYDTVNTGMNCTHGGDSFKLSQESKELIRSKITGTKMPLTTGDLHWTRRLGRGPVIKGSKHGTDRIKRQSLKRSENKIWLYNKENKNLLCWFDCGYTFKKTTGISPRIIKFKPSLIADRYIAVKSNLLQPLIVEYTHFKGSVVRWSKPVLQYTLSGEFIKKWVSAKEAGTSLGFNYKNIAPAYSGKRNYAGGFKWALEAEEKGCIEANHYYEQYLKR